METNNTKKIEKKSTKAVKKNLHANVTSFQAVMKNWQGTKEIEIDSVFSILQNITYDLISVPVTCKASVLGRTDGPKVLKIGYVNGFETHLEGEEAKLTILGDFADEFKKIAEPVVSVLVRTDKNSGEAIQVLGFEIVTKK